MRISDVSSDVCSSDLPGRQPGLQSARKVHFLVPARSSPEWLPRISAQVQRGAGALFGPLFPQALQLGEETYGIGALLAGFQRAELLQQFLLARAEFGRHFHLDLHHQITDAAAVERGHAASPARSEEHTSELQSLMRISYAVCCWKKKNTYRQ